MMTLNVRTFHSSFLFVSTVSSQRHDLLSAHHSGHRVHAWQSENHPQRTAHWKVSQFVFVCPTVSRPARVASFLASVVKTLQAKNLFHQSGYAALQMSKCSNFYFPTRNQVQQIYISSKEFTYQRRIRENNIVVFRPIMESQLFTVCLKRCI